MKKILLSMLLCEVMLLIVTGCGKKNQEMDKMPEEYDKELMQCLENELGGYLVTETDELIEIPFSEIKSDSQDKIAYYKGVYASNHPDNKYVIVFPKNGTYESSVMKAFNKYFYENFSIYQNYESPFTPSIYIHNTNQDIDFNDVVNKCVTKDNIQESNTLPSNILDKLNHTTKVVIKFQQKELGVIDDREKLAEIINGISASKQYGNICLSDAHAFDFEMYDSDNNLIDIIFLWGDGKRLLPKSINGCYFSVSNDIDFRTIIEETTDYLFYSILNYSDDDNQKEQFIYEDENNRYYLKHGNIHEILIGFMLDHRVMTLKYALENKYISAERVVKEYPDMLVKKEK